MNKLIDSCQDGSHVTALGNNEVIDAITSEFDNFGIITQHNHNVCPPINDASTLFVVAGMQPLKNRFENLDKSQLATFQSCVRTNDINEVGDGSHLTSFVMVGSFGFGSNNYEDHCVLWHRIVCKLNLPVTHVTFHPNTDHDKIWNKLGYVTRPDISCTWAIDAHSPINYCCELFCGELEIGNLVNPNSHSIDVGFGLERLTQLVEHVNRVDQTSLFDQSLTPVGRDHVRTLNLLLENGIFPGNKAQEYVCRRIFRRLLRAEPNLDLSQFVHSEILIQERNQFAQRLRQAQRDWKRNPHKPSDYWWSTHGILPEEMDLLQ